MFSAKKDEKYSLYLPYMQEALKLARLDSEDPGSAQAYVESDEFEAHDEQAKKIIRRMVDILAKKTLGKILDIEHELESAKDLREFFEKNVDIAKKILKDEQIQAALEKVSVAVALWQKWVTDPANATRELFDRTAENYPYPGIDWALGTLGGLAEIVQRFGQNQQKNYSLALGVTPTATRGAKTFLGLATMIGFGLTFVGGATAAVASPLLVALGATAVAGTNLWEFGKTVKRLYQEIKYKKDPPETYRLRVVDRSLETLKNGVTTAFYLCMAVVAIGGLIAVFSNPVGLGVLAGSLAAIATGIAVTSLVAHLLRKRTQARIKKIEAEMGLSKDENNLDKAYKPEIDSGLSLTKRARSAMQTLRRRSKNVSRVADPLDKRAPVLNAIQVNKKRTLNTIAHAEKMTKEGFSHFTEASVAALKTKQRTHHPLYAGVVYQVKETADVYHTLVVEVPHEIEKTGIKSFDKIKRLQNAQHEVEMTLTANPADRSIVVFLDMHRDLAPLSMDYCGDPKTLLKILAASKQLSVAVSFDRKDLALIRNSTDKKFKEYFDFVEALDPDEYRAHVATDKKDPSLGAIPEHFEVPKSSQNLS